MSDHLSFLLSTHGHVFIDKESLRSHCIRLESSDNSGDEHLNDIQSLQGQRILHRHTRRSVHSVILQFLKLLRSSQISKAQSQSFLTFVNDILPIPNHMPSTMNSLLRTLNIPDYFVKRTICVLCGLQLHFSDLTCSNCPTAGKKHIAYILDVDLRALLSVIVCRLTREIEEYRQIILRNDSTAPYDIPFAENYQRLLREWNGGNLLSLILHIDGINLVKSSRLSLWILNASLVELPPRLRKNRANIALCSIYIGYSEPNPMFWLGTCFSRIIELKRRGKRRSASKCHLVVQSYEIDLWCIGTCLEVCISHRSSYRSIR